MSVRILNTALGIAVLSFIAWSLFRPPPPPPDLSNESTDKLVMMICEENRVLADEVERQLLARGVESVDRIHAAISTDRTKDVAARLHILDELLADHDINVSEAADECLSEIFIFNSSDELSLGAQRLQAQYVSQRHLRGISQLENLGAKTGRSPFPSSNPGMTVPPYAIDYVTFDHQWKGELSDLNDLRRLVCRRRLIVFVADDIPNHDQILDTIDQLKIAIIRHPNHGCLGIQFNRRNLESVEIARISEDSPADKAGLQGGDTIIAINDTKVGNPGHFESLIAGAESGREIVLQVRTLQNRLHTTRLKLGTDFGTMVCRCVDEQPSTKPDAEEK